MITLTEIQGKQFALITSLKAWDKNPRGIKAKDFERLKTQLNKFGQYKPLLVTPEGEVLGGNMRLKVLQELGIPDIWVSVVEPKTEAEKFEYALSDNDRAGYYEDQQLAELIQEYGVEIPLELYKVDLEMPLSLIDVLNQFAPDVKEDEAPEVLEGEPESKLGEVYILGRHRLMCGDATKIEDVEKLMDGQKVDMVFTDPPYGVNFVRGKYIGETKRKNEEWDSIKNDALSKDEFVEFIFTAFSNMLVHSEEASPIYVWSAPLEFGFYMLEGLKKAGVHVQSQIIWKKNFMTIGQADYQWCHEMCWYGWKEGSNHYWKGGRSLTTVWDINREANNSYVHPTQKPVALASNAINNSCRIDGRVLDLFGGSGSTLIACEQLNRSCRIMELDPRYCDVIRKRYDNFVNQK